LGGKDKEKVTKINCAVGDAQNKYFYFLIEEQSGPLIVIKFNQGFSIAQGHK
jgi:hypothetical protein